MTETELSGHETSESVDHHRAEWEGANFAMTVCDGAGGGYVNVHNQNYNETGHIYSVEVRDGEAVGCSCPHATYRGAHCKHQRAVEHRPLVVSSATATAQAHRVATDGGTQQATDHDDGPDTTNDTDDTDDTPHPQTDSWDNPVEHYDDDGVCGAGESRQCQSCGSRFEVALIAATAEIGPRWQEFYRCQNCGVRGSFRVDESRDTRTWTGMIAYPRDA